MTVADSPRHAPYGLLSSCGERDEQSTQGAPFRHLALGSECQLGAITEVMLFHCLVVATTDVLWKWRLVIWLLPKIALFDF